MCLCKSVCEISDQLSTCPGICAFTSMVCLNLFSVLWSVKTRFDLDPDVTLVTALEEALVVFGYEARQWRLIQYDLKGMRTGKTASLRHLPGGMAGVTLCGRRCLALSYGRQRTNE